MFSMPGLHTRLWKMSHASYLHNSMLWKGACQAIAPVELWFEALLFNMTRVLQIVC